MSTPLQLGLRDARIGLPDTDLATRSGPRFEPSSVSKRWLLSTNPKEMGSLYLLVAYEAGVDGTLFSMLVRTELALPFVSRVYNVLITAHAFLMIFFLIMPALLGGFTNLLVPTLSMPARVSSVSSTYGFSGSASTSSFCRCTDWA